VRDGKVKKFKGELWCLYYAKVRIDRKSEIGKTYEEWNVKVGKIDEKDQRWKDGSIKSRNGKWKRKKHKHGTINDER
jgi:hypothetical protein